MNGLKRSLVWCALLASLPLTASADETLADPYLATLPLEAGLVVGTVEQLKRGGKERTLHALLQLEHYLALEGSRAAAVDEALARAGALALLKDISVAAKQKATRALAEELRAAVEDRLGLRLAESAPVWEASELGQMSWLDRGAGVSWVSFAAREDRELSMQLKDCATASVATFTQEGRRFGGTLFLDDFLRSTVPVPADGGQVFVRLEADDTCDAWQLGLMSQDAPLALAGVTSLEEPARLEIDTPYRVMPDVSTTLSAVFQAEPGARYRVRTFDLAGNTDTRVTVTPPGQPGRTDDDGGGGLSSAVEFFSLSGGEAVIEVELLRADRDSAYRIEVETVFAYDVAAPLVAEGGEMVLPAEVWSGYVVPLTMSSDEVVFQFSGIRGTSYKIQTNLDVALTDERGDPAFRVIRDETPRSWSVHPYYSFVALESETLQLRLRRPEGADESLGFLQVLAEVDAVPVPQLVSYPKSARRPMMMAAEMSADWDGGVMGVLEGLESGWVEFEAARDTAYVVMAESEEADAQLQVQVFASRASSQPLTGTEEVGPVVSLQTPAGAPKKFVARVTNMGSEPTRVRTSVQGYVNYDGLAVGDKVKIGRHSAIDGSSNWSDDMAVFVGKNGVITEHVGRDASGSWVVRLDIDNGSWVWRTRNLSRAD